jgi:hypothetical protein
MLLNPDATITSSNFANTTGSIASLNQEEIINPETSKRFANIDKNSSSKIDINLSSGQD